MEGGNPLDRPGNRYHLGRLKLPFNREYPQYTILYTLLLLCCEILIKCHWLFLCPLTNTQLTSLKLLDKIDVGKFYTVVRIN